MNSKHIPPLFDGSPANPQKNNQRNNYWGFWTTSAFGLLVFVVFSIIQTLFLLLYVMIEAGDKLSSDSSQNDLQALLRQYAFDGDAIAIAEIPAALIGMGLIILLIVWRKTLTTKDYLGLTRPAVKPLLIYLGLMIVAMILMEVANAVLERPTPEFMSKVYYSTDYLPLLWIAVGVAAPFFEEFLFRGFILEGLRRTFLGAFGSTIISAATWAIIHMQYGTFEIVAIFFIGILLAVAKLRTQSLYVPIAMHMLMNLAASVGMAMGN